MAPVDVGGRVTGRDAVAVVLAIAVALILVVLAIAVAFGGYRLTGEGVLGAVVGALVVAVLRYLSGSTAER